MAGEQEPIQDPLILEQEPVRGARPDGPIVGGHVQCPPTAVVSCSISTGVPCHVAGLNMSHLLCSGVCRTLSFPPPREIGVATALVCVTSACQSSVLSGSFG